MSDTTAPAPAESEGGFPRTVGYLNPGICRSCGHGVIRVEKRLEPLPTGTYSVAGVQTKIAMREWMYAVCEGCGHTSRGQQTGPDDDTPTASLVEPCRRHAWDDLAHFDGVTKCRCEHAKGSIK